MKKEIIIVADYTEQEVLTLQELHDVYGLSDEFIHELISHQIIQPANEPAQEWHFDHVQLKRLQTALRLQHDLEVNLAGIALALELMDQLEELRERAAFLEKHILK